MNYWLVKSEPESYSFERFQKDKTTDWTGVRNFAARNFLKAMARGDEVFFYHSVIGKEIVGRATVVKTAFPDPTVEADEKGGWVCVGLKAGAALPRPVTLEQIKATPALKHLPLLRQGRLSVVPISAAEAKTLLRMGGA